MTREELLAMEPGRELDALVAEKVMRYRNEDVYHSPNDYLEPAELVRVAVRNYSTDISAAWEVTRKVGFYLEIEGHHHTGWKVTLGHEFSTSEWELPVAICKAALLAVMDT